MSGLGEPSERLREAAGCRVSHLGARLEPRVLVGRLPSVARRSGTTEVW